jgi:sigma-E factor negative regulatory protein RseA
MSEKLRESLSATVDDEADEFELRRVLDEMEKDPDMRDTWERYHLIGTHMRGETMGRRSDLREEVWAALDLENSGSSADLHEPVSVADDGNMPPVRKLGRMVGLAVAATVAFAVVIGIGGFDLGDSTVPAVAVNTVNIESSELQLSSEVSATDMQRANAYMMHHVQQQALNQPDVASFVKLVTYERR